MVSGIKDCNAEIKDDKTGEVWTDVVELNVLSPETRRTAKNHLGLQRRPRR